MTTYPLAIPANEESPESPRFRGPSDFNAHVVALYATDAHARGTLTEDEFDSLVAQGARRLGTDTVTQLAERMSGIETAWALGLLTDHGYRTLMRWHWPDTDRLERCYGLAIGEP